MYPLKRDGFPAILPIRGGQLRWTTPSFANQYGKYERAASHYLFSSSVGDIAGRKSKSGDQFELQLQGENQRSILLARQNCFS